MVPWIATLLRGAIATRYRLHIGIQAAYPKVVYPCYHIFTVDHVCYVVSSELERLTLTHVSSYSITIILFVYIFYTIL